MTDRDEPDALPDEGSRRPLASRETGWARSIARFIAATPLTPNAISMLSVVFASVAGLALIALPGTSGIQNTMLLVAVAFGCQMRLLCNLFDGMVAIEGGKRTPDGAFWNEFPDRVSDTVILAALGVAAATPWLGWAAAAFAILTAYVRELGCANGLEADFCGPMGKPQRMAAVTVLSVLALVAGLFGMAQSAILYFGLWAIVVGTAATVIRRSIRLIAGLRARN